MKLHNEDCIEQMQKMIDEEVQSYQESNSYKFGSRNENDYSRRKYGFSEMV